MTRDKTDKIDTSPPATLATTATLGANEWGLPDWRDAAAYTTDEQWDSDRWQWEFLRRRDDYRKAYHLAKSDNIGLHSVLDDNEGIAFFHEDAALFELDLFFDPAVSDWGSSGPLWSDPVFKLRPPHDAHERWWQIKTLTFDLGKPIAPQLDAAKELLLQEQGLAQLTPREQMAFAYGAEYAGCGEMPLAEMCAKLQRNPRALKYQPGKWAVYLRVLDAREAGASWANITEVLYLDGTLGRRKAPEGGYGPPPAQAARDLWKQACALRF